MYDATCIEGAQQATGGGKRAWPAWCYATIGGPVWCVLVVAAIVITAIVLGLTLGNPAQSEVACTSPSASPSPSESATPSPSSQSSSSSPTSSPTPSRSPSTISFVTPSASPTSSTSPRVSPSSSPHVAPSSTPSPSATPSASLSATPRVLDGRAFIHPVYHITPPWQVQPEHASNASAWGALVDGEGNTFQPAATAVRQSWNDLLVAFAVPDGTVPEAGTGTGVAWVLMSACDDEETVDALPQWQYTARPACPTGAMILAVQVVLRSVWSTSDDSAQLYCGVCDVAAVWRNERGGNSSAWERVWHAHGVVLSSATSDDNWAAEDLAMAVQLASGSNYSVAFRLRMVDVWDRVPGVATNGTKVAAAAWTAEQGAECVDCPPEESWWSLAPLAAGPGPSNGLAVCPGMWTTRPLVESIAAGGSHTCALLSTRRVQCWGLGDGGRLGYGNTDNVGDNEAPSSAGDVDVGGDVVAITTGYAHTCALLTTHRVRCWGEGMHGQLGYGSTANIGDDELPSSAGDVNVGGDVVAIAAGWYHTCALLSTHRVRCWGAGLNGQLGYGSTANIGDNEAPSSAGDVDVGGDVVAIAAGWQHTCALLSTRRVRCWGYGWDGQLGYGNRDNIGNDEVPSSAGNVDIGGDVVAITAGERHTCALLTTHRVRCWGAGWSGQLGYGTGFDIGDNEVPSSAGDVDVGGDVAAIAAAGSFTCTLLTTRRVRCWGMGDRGQLGYGNTDTIGDNEAPSSAGDVDVGGDVLAIATGERHACALLSTRRVRCWGLGEFGQLGNGNADSIGDDEVPSSVGLISAGTATFLDPFAHLPSAATVRITPQAGTNALVSGAQHTCALLSSRRVRCWGRGWYGQLGYGATSNVGDDELPSSAGDVDVGGDVVAIAAGSQHTCALLPTQRVRCWGWGWHGQVGYGNWFDVGDDEAPSSAGDVDVGGDVVAIAAGGWHSCALLTTRRVRCWGQADRGQLGYGNLENIGNDELPSSAGDVDVGEDVVAVAVGVSHTCVLLPTRRVRCWGLGDRGQLGYGNTDNIGDDELPSSAGDVNVGGDVVAIATGAAHTCALLATRRVRCWGEGLYGQLGYGSTANIGDDELPSSAGDVDVGGDVVAIAAGWYHTCALLSTRHVRCWGNADSGQLGYGDVENIGNDEAPSSTGDVEVGDDVAAIAAGEEHTCALLSTGRVRCWGAGGNGQLGYGNRFDVGDDEAPSEAGDISVASAIHEQYLIPSSFSDLTSLVAPASTLAGALPAVVSFPSLTAPVPSSLDLVPDLDFFVSAQQTSPSVCLTEAGVQLLGKRYVCVADEPQRGLAAAHGAVGAYVPPQSMPTLDTAGGSAVLVLGDFSVVALLGDPTVQVGDFNATEVRIRTGHMELHFVAPAGVGDRVPISLLSPAAHPAAISEALLALPTISYRAPTISSVTPSSGLAVLGGSSIVLSGASFGPSSVHGVSAAGQNVTSGSLQITVGGHVCLESRSILDTLVECVTPPLVGADLEVRVLVGGQEAVAASRVSVAPPVVTSVTPAYLLSGGTGLQDVEVSGTNLGLFATDFDLADTRVGGHACASVVVVEEGTSFRCVGLDASAGWVAGLATTVEVSVGGQSSRLTPGVFAGLVPVSIVAAAPVGPASTAGGVQVRVIADGLGLDVADVVAVHVEDSTGRSTTLTTFMWSESQVQFAMPAGIGWVEVRLESRVGRVSDAASVSYDAPVVTSVTPSHLLLGASDATVTLRGRNLPPSLFASSALPPHHLNVSLGGIVCEDVRVVDWSSVECASFSTSGHLSWPSSGVVEVCVGGQCSGGVLGVFEGIQRPELSETTPRSIAASTEITLLGSHFGLSQADLGVIRIADVACTASTWFSESSAKCLVPSTHPLLTGLSGPDAVDVVLCNAASVCSEPLSVFVAGRGDVAKPVTTPEVSDAYRTVGQFDVVSVSWLYPSLEEELHLVDLANTTADVAARFVVQVSPDALFESTLSVEAERSAQSVSVSVSRRSPYFVRVAARTAAGGVGNWSEVFGPVFEACSDIQFLRSHASDLADRVCDACPESFAVCGGLSSENVTAQAGYWRVSWAERDPSAPLRFAACVVPEACQGWSGALPRSNASSAQSSRRTAVPDLHLIPSEEEGCAEGHRGVLCDSCSVGYFKGMNGLCAPCGPAVDAAFRVVGAALAIIFVISNMLARNVLTASQRMRAPLTIPATAPPVMPAGRFIISALKIFLNHFQTIAIVASARIAWPNAVVGFFSVANSGSNLSTQGVGLECMLGEAGKSPFVMQSLTIYVLAPASLSYALLFWLCYDPVTLCTGLCCKRTPTSPDATASPTESPPSSPTSRSPADLSRSFGRRMRMSVGLLAVTMAATVSTAAFRLLTCRTVQPERLDASDDVSSLVQRRMVSNLDYRCDDNMSLALGLALPPLLLYSLGLPLYLSVVLGRGVEDGSTAWELWSFATVGYRSSTRWWESWVMLRKLCLVAVSVLLSTESPFAQLASAMIVTMAALGAHSWWKPFESDTLNSLEMAAHVAAGVTIVAGQYIAADGEASSAAAIGATVAVLVVNVAFIMAVILAVLTTVCHVFARPQIEKLRERRSAALQPLAADPPSPQLVVGTNPMKQGSSEASAEHVALSRTPSSTHGAFFSGAAKRPDVVEVNAYDAVSPDSRA